MTKSTPTVSKLDHGHALVKAALSTIPVIGGPAVELFQSLVQPPIERRRTEWMKEIGERLELLEQRGVNLDSLGSNDQFVTAVLQATAAAVRTHQKTKLKALQNAVINIAVGAGPEDTLLHMLLQFIDEFSAMHLRVLEFARHPVAPTGVSMASLGYVLEKSIPDLDGQAMLFSQIWKDLYIRGLVTSENLNTTLTGFELNKSRTSLLGNALLELVKDVP